MKILIAIDDSEYSTATIESVRNRPWSSDTEFMVLSVVEPALPEYAAWHSSYVPILQESQNEILDQAKHLVDEAVESLRDGLCDRKIEGKVEEGNIRDCIVATAETWDADLLIVGSHGRTGFSRFLLGSVSEAVVGRAPCSVEVIKIKKPAALHTFANTLKAAK